MSDPTTAVKGAAERTLPTQASHPQSAEAVLQCVGRACFEHLRRHEPLARAGDPEGIHQMRVSIRRLKAILSGFAAFIPATARRRASDELRWFGEAPGKARNLDVVAAEILAPACAALPQSSEFERLTRAVERRQALAHVAVRAAINSDRYANSVVALATWFDACGWRRDSAIQLLVRPISALGPMVLQRRFQLVKKRAKHFRHQSKEKRHQLRIALKKLRNSAELLAGLYADAKTGPFIGRLKRLQEDLGYLNDVRVAREVIARMAVSASPNTGVAHAGRRVLAWHEHRLRRNARSLRKHLRRLLETEPFWSTDKPRAFCADAKKTLSRRYK